MKYPVLHQMKNIRPCIRDKISAPASDEISGPAASDNWFGREPETDNWLSFTTGQEEPLWPPRIKNINDEDLKEEKIYENL